MNASADRFRDAVAAGTLTIPDAVKPWGRGWCAAAASILEAAAAKPGNVSPGQSFADLNFTDLVAAGSAIAGPIDRAADRPLGETILAAVEASVAAASSNANLGIILLIAPLAAAPADGRSPTAATIEAVLKRLTPADAAAIWRAIQGARPGGMGTADRHDLAGPPPTDIREAMALAAPRDTIAALWTHGFGPLLDGPVMDLATDIQRDVSLETAIIRAHVRQLARQPDSLIARRHGEAVAGRVSENAAELVAMEHAPGWQEAIAAFDASLRAPRRLNPGTTADLIAAALYILLQDGRLRPAFLVPRPR